ncbi:MAG: flagellar export chaperone FlgN [Synergistales bacterium]|nr:flagellar export chaperone FlgN [Synergistales bacterium]
MLPDDVATPLKELLEQERLLYSQLHDKVQLEERCVEEAEWEKLLQVLQEKQALISQQENLQEQWAEWAAFLGVEGTRESPAFWNAVAHRLTSSKYKELAGGVEEIRQLAAATLSRERKVQDRLEQDIEALRAQMMQIQRGKAAYRSYMKAGGDVYRIVEPRS